MSGSQKLVESQRAKTAFRESEEHYRAVAEAATDAIITIDSDSTILVVNPAAERIFGYSTEEMIGQPLTMLMLEYLRHLHKAGITRYMITYYLQRQAGDQATVFLSEVILAMYPPLATPRSLRWLPSFERDDLLTSEMKAAVRH